ncbi:MAG: chemotaxis protein CheB [Candidatus Kapabacteria bacterium]|nr:chemotaxis protein CheB [Candidatus Kapabacteria bacterium]
MENSEKKYKILIAEDEITNSLLLKRLLTKANYDVTVTNNGAAAFEAMQNETFDAVLTDWMMPNMDGIELIQKMRSEMKELPLIVMITALVSEGSRNIALEAGADEFIAKPIDVEDLLIHVKDGLCKKNQSAMPATFTPTSKNNGFVAANANTEKPPFVGVGVATSTGGPSVLIDMFRNIPEDVPAAFYLIQHGPIWMLDLFTTKLQSATALKVYLAQDGQKSERGRIYVAPADKHLTIDKATMKIVLDDNPKINFVRPSADPLFTSLSYAFGKYSIGVILTGLGRDGVQGVSNIAEIGGKVIVQDPLKAVAPLMPQAVIDSGINLTIAQTEDLAFTTRNTIDELYAN